VNWFTGELCGTAQLNFKGFSLALFARHKLLKFKDLIFNIGSDLEL
jgi:hypothetical protein